MRQKTKFIQGANEADFKQQLDDWLATSDPQVVINLMTIDIPNNRGLFIYSEKIEPVIPE